MGYFSRIVYLTGAYQISKPFYNVYVSYKAHNYDHNELDPNLVTQNLKNYAAAAEGEKPWAIITGASEGIGK